MSNIKNGVANASLPQSVMCSTICGRGFTSVSAHPLLGAYLLSIYCYQCMCFLTGVYNILNYYPCVPGGTCSWKSSLDYKTILWGCDWDGVSFHSWISCSTHTMIMQKDHWKCSLLCTAYKCNIIIVYISTEDTDQLLGRFCVLLSNQGSRYIIIFFSMIRSIFNDTNPKI